MNLQLVIAHVDQPARVRVPAPLERRRDALIGGAGERQQHDDGEGRAHRAREVETERH
jgi:hypothetical protein